MATFPSISPQFSTQETVTQDSLRIKLGDGYEQRFVSGLPANKRLITLNTFLDARFDDQANFDYTPPHHSSALKFICTARSRTAILNNRVSMNLTFEQVAEP